MKSTLLKIAKFYYLVDLQIRHEKITVILNSIFIEKSIFLSKEIAI